MTAQSDTARVSGHGIIVFLVWQSLPYGIRMASSILLVLTGIALQVYTGSFLVGIVPLAAGNLLLLVRGYDNRVDVKRFAPGADWQKVDRARLEQVVALDKSIRKWDRSAVDATNVLGATLMILVVTALGAAAVLSSGFTRILALDALVLLVPHWFTGVRRILRFPKVVVRAEALADVLDGAAEIAGDGELEIMMLLKGKEVRVPDDIKFRLTFPEQEDGFLGLYGQVVINDVQGRSYPYFYVVTVARKGYGLGAVSEGYHTPTNMTKEYDTDAEVEFVVLRQTTTKTSGYHTKPEDALTIFTAGYALARQAAYRGEAPAPPDQA